jgi:hypothetical protein
MKKIIFLCVLAAPVCLQAGAMTDDDLSEITVSTDTVRSEPPPEEDEALAEIQESDEDLAGFVQDYIKKDAALKGAFFIEEPASGRVLKLNLETVAKKSSEGPNGSRIMEAVFKGPGGKKYSVLFQIQSAGFGGIDIFKLELKKEEKPKKK